MVKNGKKASPVSVSLQIRNERDEYGNFSPNDWISQKVRSLYAPFQRKLTKESKDREKRPKLELGLKSEDEDLNYVISDWNAVAAFNTVTSVTDICIERTKFFF